MLRNIVLFLATLVAVSSCETVMDDLDVGKTPDLLTIEGMLTDSAMVHTVKLTRTRDYFSKEAFVAEVGAEVTITDLSTGTIISKLTEAIDQPGVYQTEPDISGEIGKAYRIDVVTGTEHYSAADSLFSVSTLDEVIIDPFEFYKEWNALYITSTDPQGIDNYYTWRIYFNDVLYDDYSDVPFADDSFLAEEVEHIMLYHDNVDAEQDNITNITEPITVKVQQLGISKEAYNFFLSLNELLNKGGMFDSPMAEVKTNFWKLDTNGQPIERQAGFFITAGISEKQIIYAGKN